MFRRRAKESTRFRGCRLGGNYGLEIKEIKNNWGGDEVLKFAKKKARNREMHAEASEGKRRGMERKKIVLKTAKDKESLAEAPERKTKGGEGKVGNSLAHENSEADMQD